MIEDVLRQVSLLSDLPEEDLARLSRVARLGARLAEVAHELKNPATAVRRGADHLADLVDRYGATERGLGEAGASHHPGLDDLGERARATARSPRRIDALDRSDAEAAVEEWLDARSFTVPLDAAPALVELGYDPGELDALAAGFEGDAFAAVLPWLTATHELHSLLAEIGDGANRIAEILNGLKEDSNLEGPPSARPVDIHEGLDSTLRVLRGKLEQIEVRREYADALPEVEGSAGELNQVWTNLIDNAARAMDGEGTLTLRTRPAGDWVEVEVEDDGPGIPAGVREHIFDAFVTGDTPGRGSGLGLHISHHIVVSRHEGELRVSSEPGQTTFTVRLPRGAASRRRAR